MIHCCLHQRRTTAETVMCLRYSNFQKEMNTEVAAMKAEHRRKKLNRSVLQGSVDPLNNTKPKSESLQKQEKHVANCQIRCIPPNQIHKQQCNVPKRIPIGG